MAIKVSKSSLSIGTTAAAHLTDTYKVISGLSEMGEIGAERGRGTVSNINTGTVEVYEQSLDPATVEATFTYDSADVGQAAVEAAHASGGAFNMMFTLSNNVKIYFKAYVLSAKLVFGSDEDVAKLQCTFAQTSGAPIIVKPV